jgi:dolichyl-phosphate beta-glucosyltransferase
MLKLFLPTLIVFGIISLVGLYVWILDPILHFTHSPGPDLSNSDNYLVVDKYEDDPALQPSVNFTIIFPAYNEEYRLGRNIEGAIHFLDDFCLYRNWTYEIMVVDDGSTDNTALLTLQYFDQYPDIIRLVSLTKNVGKGGAVRVGMENAHGQYILMADSDGATEIADLEDLFAQMNHLEIEAAHGLHRGPAGIVVGSRAHLAKESMAKRAWYRTILMKGFHLLVMLFATQNVQDTQCGFKLFTKEAARLVFPAMHTRRWAFDIEMIVIAESLGIPIKEVPVNWREVEGSKLIVTKLDIITTSLTMARDIIAIRLAYLLGFWELPLLPNKIAAIESTPTNSEL